MTTIKTIFGLLVVAVTVVGVVAFGAGQASAASAPIVIPYQKTCVAGHCEGTFNGVEVDMQFTLRPTGNAAQLTVTEEITVENSTLGTFGFTAELNGHFSPAGFIVLSGTVTSGSFAGARVHQRSNFMGFVGGDVTKSAWTGELRLMPASA